MSATLNPPTRITQMAVQIDSMPNLILHYLNKKCNNILEWDEQEQVVYDRHYHLLTIQIKMLPTPGLASLPMIGLRMIKRESIGNTPKDRTINIQLKAWESAISNAIKELKFEKLLFT